MLTTYFTTNVESAVFLIYFNGDDSWYPPCLLDIGPLCTNSQAHQMFRERQHLDNTHLLFGHLQRTTHHSSHWNIKSQVTRAVLLKVGRSISRCDLVVKGENLASNLEYSEKNVDWTFEWKIALILDPPNPGQNVWDTLPFYMCNSWYIHCLPPPQCNIGYSMARAFHNNNTELGRRKVRLTGRVFLSLKFCMMLMAWQSASQCLT